MLKKYLILSTRDELLRLDCSKIVYMVGDGNNTEIRLVKLNAKVCMNLSEIQRCIEEQLGEDAMMLRRVGKSHIINTNFIHRIIPQLQKLTLSDEENFNFIIPDPDPKVSAENPHKRRVSKEALKELKEQIEKGII